MSGGAGSTAAGGPSAGGPQGTGNNTTGPASASSELEQHLQQQQQHHGLGSVTPGPQSQDSTSSTPVSQSGKSAFIELQHNNLYNPSGLRGGYHGGHNVTSAHQFSAHQAVAALGGHQGTATSTANQQHNSDPSFPSPRSALTGYPFAPMHQHNAYGYHLGSYAPQCPSPPKDGDYPNCKYLILDKIMA